MNKWDTIHSLCMQGETVEDSCKPATARSMLSTRLAAEKRAFQELSMVCPYFSVHAYATSEGATRISYKPVSFQILPAPEVHK